MEFSRQDYCSEKLLLSPGDLPYSGIKPGSPALQVDSLPSKPPGRPIYLLQFSSVHAQSCPTLCDSMNRSTPGLPVHHQSRSSPKLMSIKLVMPSNHLILFHPLLLLPSIFPSIRVLSNESALRIRWPKYSTSVLPMNTQDLSPLGWTG